MKSVNKIFSLLIYLEIIPGVCFSQKAVIHLVDKNYKSIDYVTVYDTTKGLYTITDSAGEIDLSFKEASLRFERIGYKPVTVNYSLVNGADTNIIVTMQDDIYGLDSVTISAPAVDKKKMKIAEYGDYYNKYGGYYVFNQKTKLGYALRDLPVSEMPRYLRSIKFKMVKPQKLHRHDFVIEIKIFPILAGSLIDSLPLNRLPIFIKASQLYKKNEIMVNQNIKIPHEGVFISLELPDYFDENKDTDICFMTSRTESCNEYLMTGHITSWERNILNNNSYCKPVPDYDGGYFYSSYNFGITCYE